MQGKLVFHLVLAVILDIVISVYLFVRRGIVIVVIDTVHNAPQGLMSCGEKSLHALAVLRRLDLLRVGVGHRSDLVRIHQTALQHAGIPIHLQLVRREEIIRKSRVLLDGLDVPLSLELQVVDRHHGLHAAVEGIVCKQSLQIYGHQACLPVMAVDDVGLEADSRQNREGCLAEIAELLDVPLDIPVDIVAVEVVFVINKIDRHTLVL